MVTPCSFQHVRKLQPFWIYLTKFQLVQAFGPFVLFFQENNFAENPSLLPFLSFLHRRFSYVSRKNVNEHKCTLRNVLNCVRSCANAKWDLWGSQCVCALASTFLSATVWNAISKVYYVTTSRRQLPWLLQSSRDFSEMFLQ